MSQVETQLNQIHYHQSCTIPCYKYDVASYNPFVIQRSLNETFDFLSLQKDFKKIAKREVYFVPKAYRDSLSQELKHTGWKQILEGYAHMIPNNILPEDTEKEGHIYNLYQAYYLIMQAAEQYQNPVAQDLIGIFFETGMGVMIPSLFNAASYYEKAANAGQIDAQNSIGYFYFEGKGCKKDVKKGFEYIKQAADQGDVVALNNLGHFYKHGIGVDIDLDQSLGYFTLAAEQNYPIAAYHVGYAYQHGIGTRRNPNKEFLFYKISAKGEYTPGLYQYANCFFYGVGTKVSYTKALKHLQKLDDIGFDEQQLALNLEHIRTKKPIKSRNHFLIPYQNLDLAQKSLRLKAELYIYKTYLQNVLNPKFDQHVQIEQLRKAYHLIYDNIEQPFSLLTQDELNDLLQHLCTLIIKIQNFDPDNIAHSPEEVQESFLADLALSKKSSKKKTPAKAKGKVTPQQTKVQPKPKPKTTEIKVPQSTPSPVPAEVPAPAPKQVVKKPVQAPKEKTAEDHVRQAFKIIKKRETQIKKYYFNSFQDSGPTIRRLESLFNKEKMHSEDVSKLMQAIAEKEGGSIRELEKGGKMPMLTLGPYTCGGHKHKTKSKQTDVDPGMLRDLRQVLEAHYLTQKKV